MPTSYTSLLGLALPVTGELAGTWGDTVNDYISKYVDSSVAGTQTISGSQIAVTLSRTTGASLQQVGSGAGPSTGSSQYAVINCTGNPAGTLTVTIDVSTGSPTLSNSTYSQTFAVINATSTSQSVVVRATTTSGTSTGTTLVAGEKAVVAWNGSDFIKVATSAVDGVSTISFGSTGLTPSTATSGAVTVAGTLVAANGGTGQSSYTTGDLLYATGSTALSKLGIGTNGQILTSTGTAPQWSTLSGVAVTTFSAGTTGFTPSSATSGAVTLAGTLATTNGGTGLTSFTANGVVYASSTSALTTGSALTFDGTNIDLATVGAKVNFATTGSATRNYVGVSADGYSLEMVMQRGASQPLSYKQNFSVGHEWGIAGSGAMTLTTTGLGIGTSSPNEKLVVSGGCLQVTGSLQSLNRPSSSVVDFLSGATRFFSIGANSSTYGSFSFRNATTTANTEVMAIDSSGNLGLGVTPSAWTRPAIQVGAAGTVAYFAATNVAAMTANMFYDGQNKYIGTGASTQYAQSAGAHVWYTAPSGTAGNAITFTQAMTLDSSGNLGIGTSSPTGRLHISTASGNTDFVHNVTGAGTAARTTYQRSGSVVFYAGLGAWSGTDTYQIASTSGPLTTIDTSGNLGLGVTPSAWVSTWRAFQVGGSSGHGGSVYTNAGGTTGQIGVGQNWYFNGSNNLYITSAAASDYYQFGGAHVWRTAGSGTAGTNVTFTQAMTLDASGNLGIGVTSMSYPLDVKLANNQFILAREASTNITNGFRIGGVNNEAKAVFSANSATGEVNLGAINTNYFLTFSTNGANERFRIASNGAWGLSGANYGTSGQVLTSNGSGSAPTWQNAGGGGGSAATPTALGTVYGLTQDTSGNANTVLGYQSLNANTTGSSNIAMGVRALYSNTSGARITALGYNALYNSTTSSDNTAVGSLALLSNTTGSLNTAVGSDALRNNTTASNNIAVGYQSLYTNTTGASNVAVGVYAGYYTTTGNYNVFVGSRSTFYNAGAGQNNTTGTDNTAVGGAALRGNTTGSQNVALGSEALVNNTTANNNTAVGFQALSANSTTSGHVAIGAGALKSLATGAVNSLAIGQNALTNFNPSSNATNTAVGGSALSACTTGAGNVALGRLALTALTSGQVNIAIGSDDGIGNWVAPLRSLTTGSSNVAIGPNALQALTTGGKNIGIGERALQNATTPSNNIAIGCVGGSIGNGPLQNCTTGALNIAIGGEALASLTTANGNTVVGYDSMAYVTTGPNNTAVGGYALHQATTGEANTAVGYQAGFGNTTGYWNTTNGYQAGYYITTGIQNTLIGAYNGNYVTQLTTGSYNIHLGTYCQPSSSSVNNEIVIGYNIAGKGANTAFIGGSSGAYQQNNSSSWSTVSDFRLKKNIVDNNEGLEKIAAIRVRNFEYRLPEEVTDLPEHTAVAKDGVQLGVIAQELQQVCPDCVEEQSTGVLSVNTDEIFWHMVNAIKQLKTELDTVKAELATLKGN